MALRYIAISLAIGCSNNSAAVPDAAPDVASCQSAATFTPVTVSGTSPGGSLDVYHYAVAGFVTGFCPDAYLVNFTETKLDPACAAVPWLQLSIIAPFATTGSNLARASLPSLDQQSTNQVTFEATQLDPPSAKPPHIAGHFVSHDPAWMFDIAVDLISQASSDCI